MIIDASSLPRILWASSRYRIVLVEGDEDPVEVRVEQFGIDAMGAPYWRDTYREDQRLDALETAVVELAEGYRHTEDVAADAP